MGERKLGGITIHYHPAISWHWLHCADMSTGLKKLGFEVSVTTQRKRISKDPAILFGTTFFQDIEKEKGDWLLVDRASYGDPDFVRLAWNARGRFGNHKIPTNPSPKRFECHGITLQPWRTTGTRTIVCPSYHELLPFPEEATHWKPHPQDKTAKCSLPLAADFSDCKRVITGASSVAIQCLIEGIPVTVTDPKGMAFGWSLNGREEFFRWLAWTQWTWTEIRSGMPIKHLFDGI